VTQCRQWRFDFDWAVGSGSQPSSVTVDPSGRFAYVTNNNSTVSMYTINITTGANERE
jgi:DNA-binding beta-propeller fold protein YncE